MKAHFPSRVVCISLARRQDRWGRFCESVGDDWQFGPIERFEAIDTTPGVAGCRLSHVAVIRSAFDDGCESVLILEDDAAPTGHRIPKVPDEWDVLYLGGHIAGKVEHVALGIVRPMMYCLKTHAYILNRSGMEIVLRESVNWPGHIDHHYSGLIIQKKWRALAIQPWLFGIRGETSDIT